MRFSFAAIILLSVGNFSVFAEPADDVDMLLNQASKFFKLENFEEAISYYDKALEIEPSNVSALSGTGDALVKLGKPDEAISYYDKALEIEPSNVAALSDKGDALVKLGKPEEAISYYDKALQIDQTHLDTLYQKGGLLHNQGKYPEATTYFDKVLKLDPFHGQALIKLQLVAAELGFVPLDGYLQIKVHDPQGHLVAYLKIPDLVILNHDIARNLIDDWSVIKVVTKDSKQFEMRQFEVAQTVQINNVYGGQFGIKYPYSEQWLIRGNFWQYPVQTGDMVTHIYTVFRSI